MHTLIRLSVVVAFFQLFSCSSDQKSEAQKVKYKFDKSATILEWTAFKFTEKKGVTGTFDAVNYTSAEFANSAEELVKSLTFSIDVTKVNTDNPERDEKIKRLFFGVMNDGKISGKVLKLFGNGKAQILLEMNGKHLEVPATYLLDQGSFVLECKIDVADFGLTKGIEQLNEACKDLHTGSDGISKLWSEIDLFFSTELLVQPNSN